MRLLALFLSTFLLVITSCNNDATLVNEEEVITTVTTTLTGGGQTIILTSKDIDGDGPSAPNVTVSENLVSGVTYNGTITFKNELVSPAEDITIEVEEEGVDHQLFYQLTSSLGTVTYDDVDVNGKPIGLVFRLLTRVKGNGDLIITLRHLPNKSATGVSDGDITNASGNTDAIITFPLTVQ